MVVLILYWMSLVRCEVDCDGLSRVVRCVGLG